MDWSAYRISRALPLRKDQYFAFLNGKIPEARKRIWAAVFIVNPTVNDDASLIIRDLLKKLAYAKWRNVDVRVIVGVSGVHSIGVANDTAIKFLQDLGVPAFKFVGKERRSLHSKYVVIDDDLIVVGSHNWTPGAAGRHNEDSIAIYSEEMNLLLRDEFALSWQHAGLGAKAEKDE